MIRVVVADDHHLVRQGIVALIEQGEDIEVIGEAENGIEAIGMVEQLEPDVVVMDISMPRLNGTQATERIRQKYENTRVVILSMYNDEVLVKQALQCGASAYVLKESIVDELLLAIRVAGVGGTYFSPLISKSTLSDLLNNEPLGENDCGFESLTPNEREVLQLVAEGHTNHQIAKEMMISVKTVEKYRSSLIAKLGVKELAGLIRIAIKRKLIPLDS